MLQKVKGEREFKVEKCFFLGYRIMKGREGDFLYLCMLLIREYGREELLLNI